MHFGRSITMYCISEYTLHCVKNCVKSLNLLIISPLIRISVKRNKRFWRFNCMYSIGTFLGFFKMYRVFPMMTFLSWPSSEVN